MAQELGLGITPWSPLKSGLLSGKYTRSSASRLKSDRVAFIGTLLNETTYTLVDELETIAKAHDTTVARVALAWVRTRPGVSSTIIGARRLSQLDDNLKSLDLKLTADDLAHLDSLTKPKFGFPQNMQPIFPAIHNGGTTVNGIHAPPSAFVLEKTDKPY
jgi:aryl-alcohol dehydrogenase-like predicted oxidoreductase